MTVCPIAANPRAILDRAGPVAAVVLMPALKGQRLMPADRPDERERVAKTTRPAGYRHARMSGAGNDRPRQRAHRAGAGIGHVDRIPRTRSQFRQQGVDVIFRIRLRLARAGLRRGKPRKLADCRRLIGQRLAPPMADFSRRRGLSRNQTRKRCRSSPQMGRRGVDAACWACCTPCPRCVFA